jgi:hypothetical protein
MARGRAPRRPLWLIANHDNGRMAVLTLGPGRDEEVLPVFSFEEEAEIFLRFEMPETGWRARKTTAGELVSLLCGLCAGVRKVVLDPLPVVDGGMLFDLAGPGKEDFLRSFAGESSAPRGELRAEAPVNSELTERARETGAQMRKTEEERGRENGAGDVPIPDYVMRNSDPSEERYKPDARSADTRLVSPKEQGGP